MLELRPSCECCNIDHPPVSKEALNCSFECTFCRKCVEGKLKVFVQIVEEILSLDQ